MKITYAVLRGTLRVRLAFFKTVDVKNNSRLSSVTNLQCGVVYIFKKIIFYLS